MVMTTVLLIDVNEVRREKLRKALESCSTVQVNVDDRSTIDQATYEAGGFDLAVVHYGNDEGPFIEGIWKLNNARLVLFSGGFSQPFAISNGTAYAKASHLETNEGVTKLIKFMHL